MYNRVKRNMTSNIVTLRIITTYICFLITYIVITSISYYFLPEGMLHNKNPLKNWNTSSNLAISTFQIFLFNLLSVIVIIFGNIFSKRRTKTQCFMPIGYTVFFTLIAINAVYLGTWSFSVVTDAIPLVKRIIGTFDLARRAGLWEMSGQICILCATANISLVMIDVKETSIRSWKTIKLSL